MREERQKMILELILTQPVETQQQLMELLRQRGFHCTQATLSRDIRALHLYKSSVPGGASRYAVNALDAMNRFFLLQEMFVVGSCYWPMAYGRMPGEVRSDAEGLNTMRVLGKNMAFLLKALHKNA